MRPLPSIRTDDMPRRASWAARMVPEKPPPTIATGACRSDFIIRPVLRIRRSSSARLNVVVNARHGLACRLGEDARHHRVYQSRAAGTDQLGADLDCAQPVSRPAHAERSRMFEEQPVDHPVMDLCIRLLGRHCARLAQKLVTPTGFEPVALRLGI